MSQPDQQLKLVAVDGTELSLREVRTGLHAALTGHFISHEGELPEITIEVKKRLGERDWDKVVIDRIVDRIDDLIDVPASVAVRRTRVVSQFRNAVETVLTG